MAVTIGIAAYLTTLLVADVVTNLTIVNPSAHIDKAFCQCIYPTLILPKQVQGKPQSSLAAYAWQPVDFHYSLLKKLRTISVIVHLYNLLFYDLQFTIY
jgi:uncharacterized membrane protein